MCNSELERRQAWRESDGFAKASDGMKVPAAGQAENPLVRFHTKPEVGMSLGWRAPLFIQVALGFHTQLDYQPPPYPAQREICEQMVKLGLLRHDPVDGASTMHYVPVTEALRVYVDALCSVPLPVKRWVMP